MWWMKWGRVTVEIGLGVVVVVVAVVVANHCWFLSAKVRCDSIWLL